MYPIETFLGLEINIICRVCESSNGHLANIHVDKFSVFACLKVSAINNVILICIHLSKIHCADIIDDGAMK